MIGIQKLVLLALLILSCRAPLRAQSAGASDCPRFASTPPNDMESAKRRNGDITGTVTDGTGAIVVNARVQLVSEGTFPRQDALSDNSGRFCFPHVAPGPFSLVVDAATFATKTFTGELHSGEVLDVANIALSIATTETDVQVRETRVEVAEDQIKAQEQQRVFGVIPNYYISYVPDAVALDPKQKFELAWKTLADPVSFLITGVIAGIEQGTDAYSGYGQGAQGYGKRYGAAYADFVAGTVISSAILPAILKQDPRYFYKGTGSNSSRLRYAIAQSVICRGDNTRWQPNYSSILGNLAAGGISNLYYPAKDRNGAALTFENAAIGIGANAVANVVQEFFIRRLTPRTPVSRSSKPAEKSVAKSP